MAPTCDSKSCRILKLWINKRQKTSGERVNTKPNRKKRFNLFKSITNPFPFDLNIKALTNLSSYKICLMLLILIKTVNVTVASIDVDDNNNNNDSSKNQTNLNLFKLVENKISLAKSSLNEQSHNLKVINLLSDLETKAAHRNVGNFNINNNIKEFNNNNHNNKVNGSPHVQKSLEGNTKANNPEDFRSQRSFGNVEILIRNLENETIFYDIHKRTRRKKRYVKFPPAEGLRFSGRGQGRPFHPASSVTGSYHGGIPPWASGRPNGFFQSHVPTMRPRSPRLVFRDPVEPGTLTAPGSFFGNGLQDIGFDDERGCGVSIGKLGAQRRIVGGDEAGFGSFPWQAYIRIGSSRCGGSLVNRFHVVTAGHCVARASARQVQVTLGDYVINSAVEPLPAYTFGVREIRVHPYFKFTPQADRFDVAVLKLDRPVQYMPHIAPICLPEKNEDFLGQYGWAAGWGALQAGSRLRPKTLQAVDVPVIDNRLCERWHKSNGINVVIYDEMMCAGYRNGGKDSCQGDSGGPLMMEKSNRWYLIGIVSAGYSCAQRGQPGIYHRVAHTVDWISYIINS